MIPTCVIPGFTSHYDDNKMEQCWPDALPILSMIHVGFSRNHTQAVYNVLINCTYKQSISDDVKLPINIFMKTFLSVHF